MPKRLLFSLLTLFWLTGCLPLLAPVTPAPQAAEAVQTIIAATAGAAATQTAAFQPSPTPLPSSTPTPKATVTITPTPTATVVFVFPALTPMIFPSPIGGGGSGGSPGYACVLVDQNLPNGTVMRPRNDFDVFWTLRNSGTLTWDSASVDFIYVRGDKLHKRAGYDLSRDVKPGSTLELGVDMTAPSTPGTYTTFWGLRRGKNIFCEVYLTIIVQQP